MEIWTKSNQFLPLSRIVGSYSIRVEFKTANYRGYGPNEHPDNLDARHGIS